MSNLFSKKHLLERMREAGIPCSYPTLIQLENKGVILKPQGMVGYADRKWRMYTSEEIEAIVGAVKAYREAKKNPSVKYPEV